MNDIMSFPVSNSYLCVFSHVMFICEHNYNQLRNRSPLWSFLFHFFCGPQGYGFHSIKNFRNCAKKILRRFFANFFQEIGCENDRTYIFRFVRYLSIFFYTYLPINIYFQFIIITNISFVTNPAYFVRHLASAVFLY